ncbi:beta-1,6-N-acetylglucosaminyltransferase, partial [Paenochrobactrum sp. BZR 201-1]
MRILYILLAHNEPENLYKIADTLVSASLDAEVIIHFDGNASEKNYNILTSLIKNNEKIYLASKRIKCQWGTFSLVDGTLQSLRTVKKLGRNYDYVMLLSGACLPCKPLKQLEEFLSLNNGKEFIEFNDDSWMVGGLRKERYHFYFKNGASKTKNFFEDKSVELQRFLGIKRRVPLNMEVRFGSQWWTLTWKTCLKILSLLDQNQRIEKFFRQTYIPDEMFFQTLVGYVVPHANITNYNLTFYKFTDYGKPIVFYDDHIDYVFNLNKFFYRKISNEAKRLFQASLDTAHRKDNNLIQFDPSTKNNDFELKKRAQTWFPKPGTIYYKSQYIEAHGECLEASNRPYVLVLGLRNDIQLFIDNLSINKVEYIGRLFSKSKVFEGAPFEEFYGLRENEKQIRDMDQFLYLTRVISRASALPIISWASGDHTWPLNKIFNDPNALKIFISPKSSRYEDWINEFKLDYLNATQTNKILPGLSQTTYLKARETMIHDDVVPHNIQNLFNA